MSAPVQNPAGAYGSVPEPSHTFAERGYGAPPSSRADLELPTTGPAATDFAHEGRPSTALDGSYAATNSGDTAVEDEAGLGRSASSASNYPAGAVSRSNTLKKKQSVSRKSSIKRSGSRKSTLGAGDLKSVVVGDANPEDREYNSAFHTPIPTSSSPTEILANRFQCTSSSPSHVRAFANTLQHGGPTSNQSSPIFARSRRLMITAQRPS